MEQKIESLNIGTQRLKIGMITKFEDSGPVSEELEDNLMGRNIPSPFVRDIRSS